MSSLLSTTTTTTLPTIHPMDETTTTTTTTINNNITTNSTLSDCHDKDDDDDEKEEYDHHNPDNPNHDDTATDPNNQNVVILCWYTMGCCRCCIDMCDGKNDPQDHPFDTTNSKHNTWSSSSASSSSSSSSSSFRPFQLGMVITQPLTPLQQKQRQPHDDDVVVVVDDDDDDDDVFCYTSTQIHDWFQQDIPLEIMTTKTTTTCSTMNDDNNNHHRHQQQQHQQQHQNSSFLLDALVLIGGPFLDKDDLLVGKFNPSLQNPSTATRHTMSSSLSLPSITSHGNTNIRSSISLFHWVPLVLLTNDTNHFVSVREHGQDNNNNDNVHPATNNVHDVEEGGILFRRAYRQAQVLQSKYPENIFLSQSSHNKCCHPNLKALAPAVTTLPRSRTCWMGHAVIPLLSGRSIRLQSMSKQMPPIPTSLSSPPNDMNRQLYFNDQHALIIHRCKYDDDDARGGDGDTDHDSRKSGSINHNADLKQNNGYHEMRKRQQNLQQPASHDDEWRFQQMGLLLQDYYDSANRHIGSCRRQCWSPQLRMVPPPAATSSSSNYLRIPRRLDADPLEIQTNNYMNTSTQMAKNVSYPNHRHGIIADLNVTCKISSIAEDENEISLDTDEEDFTEHSDSDEQHARVNTYRKNNIHDHGIHHNHDDHSHLCRLVPYLLVLGTGCASPSPLRGSSGYGLLLPHVVMVDPSSVLSPWTKATSTSNVGTTTATRAMSQSKYPYRHLVLTAILECGEDIVTQLHRFLPPPPQRPAHVSPPSITTRAPSEDSNNSNNKHDDVNDEWFHYQLRQIRWIWISHAHLDHYGGLPSLLRCIHSSHCLLQAQHQPGQHQGETQSEDDHDEKEVHGPTLKRVKYDDTHDNHKYSASHVSPLFQKPISGSKTSQRPNYDHHQSMVIIIAPSKVLAYLRALSIPSHWYRGFTHEEYTRRSSSFCHSWITDIQLNHYYYEPDSITAMAASSDNIKDHHEMTGKYNPFIFLEHVRVDHNCSHAYGLFLGLASCMWQQHHNGGGGASSAGVAVHVFCFSGDTRPCPRLVRHAAAIQQRNISQRLAPSSLPLQNYPSSQLATIEWLLHEATFNHNCDHDIKLAEMKGHSTHRQAMAVAEQMKARVCILTHFSQRYGNAIFPFEDSLIVPTTSSHAINQSSESWSNHNHCYHHQHHHPHPYPKVIVAFDGLLLPLLLLQ